MWFGSGLDAPASRPGVNDHMINVARNELACRPSKLARYNRTSSVRSANKVACLDRQPVYLD